MCARLFRMNVVAINIAIFYKFVLTLTTIYFVETDFFNVLCFPTNLRLRPSTHDRFILNPFHVLESLESAVCTRPYVLVTY